MKNSIELHKVGRRDVEQFDPKKSRAKLALLKEGAKRAGKIRDWELLEEAIDFIVEEMRGFTGWWAANVTPGRADGLATSPKRKVVARPQQPIPAADATRETGVSKFQVSRWNDNLENEEDFRANERLAAQKPVWFKPTRGTAGTGENEWFTPDEYLMLAREVLGGIDLDPASHPAAQKIVQATEYFTKARDGLKQEWRGRIWLNPPYAQPHIADFAAKLLEEVRAQRTTAAIILTHNYTDTTWFQDLAANANGICFTRGRVRFYEPNGEIAAPTQGQAFSYFGPDRDRFGQVFQAIGFVVMPWSNES